MIYEFDIELKKSHEWFECKIIKMSQLLNLHIIIEKYSNLSKIEFHIILVGFYSEIFLFNNWFNLNFNSLVKISESI